MFNFLRRLREFIGAGLRRSGTQAHTSEGLGGKVSDVTMRRWAF